MREPPIQEEIQRSMISKDRSMIKYPRDRIVLIFSLRDLEGLVYMDNPLLTELAIHNYPIPDFLKDFMSITLDDFLHISFLDTTYQKRYHAFFISIHEKVRNSIYQYQRFIYDYVHDRLPVIYGYCEYSLEYSPNASLYSLVIY